MIRRVVAKRGDGLGSRVTMLAEDGTVLGFHIAYRLGKGRKVYASERVLGGTSWVRIVRSSLDAEMFIISGGVGGTRPGINGTTERKTEGGIEYTHDTHSNFWRKRDW